MSYTITPSAKTGKGTASYDGSPTPSAILTTTLNGFRNVAVGASITINSITKTVSSKQSDNQVTMNSTYSTDYSGAWVYTNPAITFTTAQSINNKKSSSPMKITLPTLDSDTVITFDIDGVERAINMVLEIVSTDLDTVVIPTVESLVDGQQFTSTIPTFTTDLPARTYGVYFNTVAWEYNVEAVNKLNVTIDMLERGT